MGGGRRKGVLFEKEIRTEDIKRKNEYAPGAEALRAYLDLCIFYQARNTICSRDAELLQQYVFSRTR